MNRGKEYYDKGKFDEAIADYNAAIRLEANDATAFYHRGKAFREKGNLEEAITDNTKAIVLNPNYTDAFHNRGLAYCMNGKYDEALADLTEAIRLNPKDANHYYLRGATHARKNKLDETVSDRLYPKDSETNLWSDHGVFSGAGYRAYLALIPLNPKDTAAFNGRGLAWSNKHNEGHSRFADDYTRYSEAILDFNWAIDLDPKFAEAYTFRGLTYLRCWGDPGHLEQAVKDCTDAIRLNPKSAVAYLIRGRAGMGSALRLEQIA